MRQNEIIRTKWQYFGQILFLFLKIIFLFFVHADGKIHLLIHNKIRVRPIRVSIIWCVKSRLIVISVSVTQSAIREE
jgi:hypothetical protein